MFEFNKQVSSFMTNYRKHQNGALSEDIMDAARAEELFDHPAVNIINIARVANRMIDDFPFNQAFSYIVNHCSEETKMQKENEIREQKEKMEPKEQKEKEEISEAEPESEIDEMSAFSESEYASDSMSTHS